MAVGSRLTEAGIKSRYVAAYTAIAGKQPWTKWLREVKTTEPTGERYGGAQEQTGMIEKGSTDIPETLAVTDFLIRNREFIGSRRIEQNDWEFNKVGLVNDRVDDLAARAARHPGELSATTIAGGAATYGPDGVYFFSASHPVEGGTYSNLYAKASAASLGVTDPTYPTATEWVSAIFQIYGKMLSATNMVGDYPNQDMKELVIAVGLILYPSLVEAIATKDLGSSGTNALKNDAFRVTPILMPQITGNVAIFIHPNKSSFIYQTLVKPTKPVVLGPSSEHYKKESYGLIKVRGVYNVGFDRWQGAAKATFST